MKNHITIGDALVESVHIAMDGISIIEAVRLAFQIRKLMNRWLAHEISLENFIDIFSDI